MIEVAILSDGGNLMYYCPGCKFLHSVPPDRWNWNKSTDKPTLTPSVRHFFPACGNSPEETICHYFVTDGNIIFCGDCKHELKGQTVPLPNIREILEEDNGT
jgi:hypothetical protein